MTKGEVGDLTNYVKFRENIAPTAFYYTTYLFTN